MQTMNLQIEDSFYPHFQAILDSFIKDKKVVVVNKSIPLELLMNNVSDVREKALAAESRIREGEYVSEEQYRSDMDHFLQNI